MADLKHYDPSTHVVRERVEDLRMQRAANVNARPLAVHLTKFATYLGIGALAHAWFIGAEFDPGSLWSWGYIAAWPVPLGFWFVIQAAVSGLYVMLVIVGCAALWLAVCFAVDAYDRARYRRNGLKRMRERNESLRVDPEVWGR